jgi:hypothetical protein
MAPENTRSIWTQMGYVPPRGPCSQGKTILSSGCSCQRFMAHPLKVRVVHSSWNRWITLTLIQMASSFECDGCRHHASFHKMENTTDDATIIRWQEAQRVQQEGQDGSGSRKRPRKAIENGLTHLQQNHGQSDHVYSGAQSVQKVTAKRTVGTRSQDRDYTETDEEGRVYVPLSKYFLRR